MPRYFDRAGRQVSASEALIDGNVLRDGFSSSHQLRDGERASFEAAFFDRAGSASVFLTDTGAPISDAERDLVVAQARTAHGRRTAYLGDAAPEFTDAMADAAVAKAAQQPAQIAESGITSDERTAQAGYETAQAVAAERRRNAWRQG